ncbi:MAG: hypothetical protein ACI8Q1_001852 [Parvicella sp.]|jgi:hypothetical protein
MKKQPRWFRILKINLYHLSLLFYPYRETEKQKNNRLSK